MSLLRPVTVAGVALLLLGGTGVATATAADAVTVPRCHAGSTSVTAERLHGAANTHFGVRLHVTNTSSGACVVNGYPTVTLLDAAGHATLTAATTASGYLGGAAPARVVLAPGGEATALLEGVAAADPSSPSYARSTSVTVALPGNSRATTLALAVSNDPHLTVHGLVAGATGGTRT